MCCSVEASKRDLCVQRTGSEFIIATETGPNTCSGRRWQRVGAERAADQWTNPRTARAKPEPNSVAATERLAEVTPWTR